MRNHWLIVGSLLGFSLCAGNSSSQDGIDLSKPSPAHQSLAGLGQISLVSISVSDEAEKDGLNPEAIENDIELKLRQSKISVKPDLTRAERQAEIEDYIKKRQLPIRKNTVPGQPALIIWVKTSKRANLYAYYLRLELKQTVLLERDPNRTIHATTYSQDELGTVGAGNISQIRDAIKDLTDKFCIDYLRMNPGK